MLLPDIPSIHQIASILSLFPSRHVSFDKTHFVARRATLTVKMIAGLPWREYGVFAEHGLDQDIQTEQKCGQQSNPEKAEAMLPKSSKLFISHTHSDAELAHAIRDLMRTIFGEKVDVVYSTSKEIGGGPAPVATGSNGSLHR